MARPSAQLGMEVCRSRCFTWFLTVMLVGLSGTTPSDLLLLPLSALTYWNSSKSLQWFGLVLNRCFGSVYKGLGHSASELRSFSSPVSLC